MRTLDCKLYYKRFLIFIFKKLTLNLDWMVQTFPSIVSIYRKEKNCCLWGCISIYLQLSHPLISCTSNTTKCLLPYIIMMEKVYNFTTQIDFSSPPSLKSRHSGVLRDKLITNLCTSPMMIN